MEASAEETTSLQVEALPPRSATWRETFDNVMAPTAFGMGAGALWEALAMPHLSYGMPNPPQRGLLLMLLFAPLLHRLLTNHPQGRWKEYLAGAAALAFPLMLIWSTGFGGFVHLPPFRLAIWHTMGVNIGALGGSLLYFSMMA